VCLQSAVSALASRTTLLDPAQLDQVESQLAVVQQRLTELAEKKDTLEQSGKLNKVFSGLALLAVVVLIAQLSIKFLLFLCFFALPLVRVGYLLAKTCLCHTRGLNWFRLAESRFKSTGN